MKNGQIKNKQSKSAFGLTTFTLINLINKKEAEYIIAINLRFPNFIIREKDNNDNRKFVYRVHEQCVIIYFSMC